MPQMDAEEMKMLEKNIKKNKLENWMGECLEFEALNKKVIGTIQYGIRIPCAGAMEPLKIVEIGSKEKVDREKPHYYFVGYLPGYRIRLLTTKIKEEKITGHAVDMGIFKYNITRKK